MAIWVDVSSTRRGKVEKKIMESVQAQVKIEVGEWGRSDTTKKLIENLKNMTEENDVLFKEARVKLDNSYVLPLPQKPSLTRRRSVAGLATIIRPLTNKPISRQSFRKSSCPMAMSAKPSHAR